jgi:ferritin-like protein
MASDRGAREIVTARLSRDQLLRRGAIGGGTLVLAGSALAGLAGSAGAATVPDGDLAYLRLLVAAELLAADFEAQALGSGKLSRASGSVFRKMAADEKAHYGALSQLVTGAGQVPATADDIDFTYPKNSFASETSILKRAAQIEALVLGAYLGAVENLQTQELRLPIAQIAANEAQHVGALAAIVGRPVIGRAFAPSLQIDAASAALDAFES